MSESKMKEIFNSRWNYTLYEDSDGSLILTALCGTVGLFETNIFLNEDETAEYMKSGKEYILQLASAIRSNPERYAGRHVELRGKDI